MSRTLPRSAIAALAGLVLVGAVVLTTAARAESQPPLPDVAPAELLASVCAAMADPPPVAGDVAATLALGLPEVEFEGAGAEELGGASELAGDKRLRVWHSDDGLRVAELRDASERALITDGDVLWTWDSTTLEATRTDLPDDLPAHDRGHPAPAGDPVELAEQALAAADATTAVSIERTSQVAGRDAYRLVLEPRTDQTLVGRVELDVDAVERLPLRVAVYARGAADPAVEAGYTRVSFDPIDPATFTFTPPPGATVVEKPLPPGPSEAERQAFAERYAERLAGSGGRDAQVVGEGWATVVAVPTGGAVARAGASGQEGAQEFAGLLPFSGTLLSARTETIGGEEHLLVGAVPQAVLQAAAAELQG